MTFFLENRCDYYALCANVRVGAFSWLTPLIKLGTPGSPGSPEMSASHFVYVLQLEGNRFYVGTTTDVDRRVRQHSSGEGAAAFTRKYRLVREVREERQEFGSKEEANQAETTKTLKLMIEKGIDNVRGGEYAQTSQTTPTRATLYLSP